MNFRQLHLLDDKQKINLPVYNVQYLDELIVFEESKIRRKKVNLHFLLNIPPYSHQTVL